MVSGQRHLPCRLSHLRSNPCATEVAGEGENGLHRVASDGHMCAVAHAHNKKVFKKSILKISY